MKFYSVKRIGDGYHAVCSYPDGAVMYEVIALSQIGIWRIRGSAERSANNRDVKVADGASNTALTFAIEKVEEEGYKYYGGSHS